MIIHMLHVFSPTGRKFDYAIATGKRGDEEITPQE
jgi:hypothetical protein